MSPLSILNSSWVYQNPKPHLRAIHAFHPCLNRLPDGSWIATFDLGQGVESLDYHTVLARSADAETWQLQGPILPASPSIPPTTHSVRTAALSDGRLVGFGARFYREDPEEGILNRETMGLCRTDLIWTESHDHGLSWSDPQPVTLPVAGEAWEASHNPLELPDGTLALPVAAWRNWDGKLPDGEQSLIALSHDGGRTWPEFRRTFDGRKTGLIHWEQCVIPFADGLLAVAWVYDPASHRSLPSVFSIAPDTSNNFPPSQPMGFHAETCEILALENKQVLAVYRRVDQPGLWAEMATVEDDRWIRHPAIPLWQGAQSGMHSLTNATEAVSGLKFGSPSLKRMDDGTVLVLFWCQEDGISGIRWLKLGIS